MKPICSIMIFIAILCALAMLLSSCSLGKYVSSTKSSIFHKTSCEYAKNISSSNKEYYGSVREALDAGETPCSRCKPAGASDKYQTTEQEVKNSRAAFIAFGIMALLAIMIFVFIQKESKDTTRKKRGLQVILFAFALLAYLVLLYFVCTYFAFLSVLRIIWMVIGAIWIVIFVIGHFVKLKTLGNYLETPFLMIVYFAIVSIPILILIFSNF